MLSPFQTWAIMSLHNFLSFLLFKLVTYWFCCVLWVLTSLGTLSSLCNCVFELIVSISFHVVPVFLVFLYCSDEMLPLLIFVSTCFRFVSVVYWRKVLIRCNSLSFLGEMWSIIINVWQAFLPYHFCFSCTSSAFILWLLCKHHGKKIKNKFIAGFKFAYFIFAIRLRRLN